MKIENFLNEKGLELVETRKILNSMNENSKNILLKQFSPSVKTLLTKQCSMEDFAIELVKKSQTYGSYKDYICEKYDTQLAELGFKDYSIMVDDYNNVYVEKIARYNSNFMNIFFDIDLNNASKKDLEFINEFMKHKRQAILNAIKYSLKTDTGVYVAYEKRKIIARYFINNKKSNNEIYSDITTFLETITKVFEKHVYVVNFLKNEK